MNRQEHLLVIASEECSEVAHRISKALRFGLNEIQPGQELTNGQRIMCEFHELLATVEMLMDEYPQQLYTGPWLPSLDDKKARIEKYLKLSAKCGTLNGSLPAAGTEAQASTQHASKLPTEEVEHATCTFCQREIQIGDAIYTVTGNHYDCERSQGAKYDLFTRAKDAERAMDVALNNMQKLLKGQRDR